MHPFTLDPARPGPAEALLGAVITEEVKADGKRLFHKGHRLGPDDLAALARVDRPLHAVRLEAGDVHEDEAGRRLAAAVAGDGLSVRGPVQSRYNLVAAVKGLLRVDPDAITALNRLPGIAVFTLQDRLPVLPGRIVAGVKITPVAVPEATLREAEAMAAARPTLRVAAFRPLRVGVVTTEGLSEKLRERFRETVRRKLGWYGASVLRFEDLANDPDAVAPAIEGLIGDGADLVLTGGGNTIDPLDPTLVALPRIGAEIVKFGAPAHPGSMFWLARRGGVPIFNLASCSMYSKATVADLILPWIMAGERVSADDLAALGYGGLLDRGMVFRFPDYERDTADDEDE
ncbi:MAG: molybdopterin-binding protein [Chloroflexota bacterium]|nr:molybdopterin-binding protein [Chloroflexota bacterium]